MAIGLFRGGNQRFLTAVGLLLFFPVSSLASPGIAKRTAIVVGVGAALLIVRLPVLFSSGGFTLEQLAKPLHFPLVVRAFAITVSAVTNTFNLQSKALETKDVQLHAALNASQQRERLLETVLDTLAFGLVVDSSGNDILMNLTQKPLHAHALPHHLTDPMERELLVFAGDASTLLDAQDRPVRRAVSTAARPMLDANGGFDGAVIAFHDVTEMMAALEAKNYFCRERVPRVSHPVDIDPRVFGNGVGGTPGTVR